MSSYVVYDTLRDTDASHRRKIRVDKHLSLDDAKRSAQSRFLRFTRAPQPEMTVECITVETNEGEILYELPEAVRNRNQAHRSNSSS